MIAGSPNRIDGFAPLRDYAVLSDQRTAALVARDGAIDWLCLPRFDGEPVFGALLAPGDGGRFALRPAADFEVRRRYLPDTNVLETTWTTDRGVVRVTDALTLGDHRQPWIELARHVEGVAGEVELEWEVRPRAGWERSEPERVRVGGVPAFACGEQTVVVRCWDAGAPRSDARSVRGRFGTREGSSSLLVLEACEQRPLLLDGRERVLMRLEETAAAWRRWLGSCTYEGPWGEQVRRSLLALGACLHSRSGAFVAAPTTSLPERIGGSRNYDYRFCWLRDTSFALDAMLRSGLQPVVHNALSWLLHASRATAPRMYVCYSIDGAPGASEVERPWPGYRGSRPVLSGNGAASQLQLGGYGDVLETAWLWVRDGNALDPASARQLADIATHVCHIWHNPDAGIWELGSQLRDYTKSKADAWVTVDRALRLADREAIPGDDAATWRATRAAVREWVDRHCWSDALGCFRRAGDRADDLDAALLLLARMDFEPGDGARMRATVDAVRTELSAGGPLLYRFSGADEIEGAFIACSFWLVDALARAGDLDGAARQMDEALELVNDVGLLSEEVDPSTGDLLGNFPQALSHLALINAATAWDEQHQRRSADARWSSAPM